MSPEPPHTRGIWNAVDGVRLPAMTSPRTPKARCLTSHPVFILSNLRVEEGGASYHRIAPPSDSASMRGQSGRVPSAHCAIV